MIGAPAKPRIERLLEKSGRITPREVLEAYEETGLKVGSQCFLEDEKGCAYGALMMRDGVATFEMYGDRIFDQDAIDEWARSTSDEYAQGFFRGFDGIRAPAWPPTYDKGYRDGKRVRRFVEAYIGFSDAL